MNQEEHELKNREEWDKAESKAQAGDNSDVVKMLRELHLQYEIDIPNLWFLADLIEGKFKKVKGRPSNNKINAGLKQRLAAETAAYILDKEKVTQEDAFERAAKILPMSESAIKKHYVNLKDENLIEESLFKKRISRSIK